MTRQTLSVALEECQVVVLESTTSPWFFSMIPEPSDGSVNSMMILGCLSLFRVSLHIVIIVLEFEQVLYLLSHPSRPGWPSCITFLVLHLIARPSSPGLCPCPDALGKAIYGHWLLCLLEQYFISFELIFQKSFKHYALPERMSVS